MTRITDMRGWLLGDGIWAKLAACAFRDKTSTDPCTMDYGTTEYICDWCFGFTVF